MSKARSQSSILLSTTFPASPNRGWRLLYNDIFVRRKKWRDGRVFQRPGRVAPSNFWGHSQSKIKRSHPARLTKLQAVKVYEHNLKKTIAWRCPALVNLSVNLQLYLHVKKKVQMKLTFMWRFMWSFRWPFYSHWGSHEGSSGGSSGGLEKFNFITFSFSTQSVLSIGCNPNRKCG